MAQRPCWATLEPMSEAYRLIFRAEVLEGQHPAVVRKRLAEAAGFRRCAARQTVLRQTRGGEARRRSGHRGATAGVVPQYRRAAPRASRWMRPPVTLPNCLQRLALQRRTLHRLACRIGSCCHRAAICCGRKSARSAQPGRRRQRPVAGPGTVLRADDGAEPGAGPDVSHLSLAAPGALLGASRRCTSWGPCRHRVFEVAEVGADLSPRRSSRPPPQVPDTRTCASPDEA
jgi:hypothetical protein